jgi:hypothetical protein
MKRKRPNIIILALFQALIFVAPLCIKDIHHHQGNSIHLSGAANNKVFSGAEKPCAICQYEFVHFISCRILQYSFLQPAKPLINSKFVTSEHKSAFAYFSHRAPPLA